ncbi:phosphotransferase [Rubrobacter aplysinae]|uniref:phosphotransferase n=1 Tax=Rubrobacter aplysinae TaxID=909625 RepID=UPI00064B8593|nr:phosphotransferase [Rubrobacter aplysinae]
MGRSPELGRPKEEELKDKPHEPVSDTLGLEVSLGDGGRAYAAYPNLRGARWLFPAGRKEIRRAGLREFFHPRSLKGRAFRAAVASGGFRGQRVSLAEEPLEKLEHELAGILGAEVDLGFYVGSPGAYRKSTALVLDATGRTLAFARIATNPRTRAKLEAERHNLLWLSGSPELHGRVPRVLGHFHCDASEVLVISGGPPWPGPDSITGPHLDFCQVLFECSVPDEPGRVFSESPAYTRLFSTLERIESGLPEETSSLLYRAADRLGHGLGEIRVPLSVAHGDFAPWNTRIGTRGLFVFDWDYTAERATPLHDLFYFHSIQSALLGRREHLPGRDEIESLLRRIWPEGRRHLPWLYLAYLLDVSLLYGEARVIEPDAGEDRVWRWFLDRIQSFLDDGSPL